MKRSSLILLFMALLLTGYSQSDTLFTKNKKKIPCKITEIGESEIKYKTPDNLDGPVYIISIVRVYKYSLSNGQVVLVTPDELLVENQHQEVMNRRTVIKVHPFSYVNNQIGISYEQVLKMGTNLDLEAGYINNSIMPEVPDYRFRTSTGSTAFMSGLYFKPGVKFLIGQDFSLKGMKYAHPLKGRFILINAVFSYLNYQNVYWAESQTHTSGYYPSYNSTIVVTGKTADLNAFAYGAMINYGRQFLLGNVVTLEYYIGVGATGQSSSESNSAITTTTYTSYGGGYNYYNYNYGDRTTNINNYHGFFRVPRVGISYALGFRIGFLLPEKKTTANTSGSSNQEAR